MLSGNLTRNTRGVQRRRRSLVSGHSSVSCIHLTILPAVPICSSHRGQYCQRIALRSAHKTLRSTKKFVGWVLLRPCLLQCPGAVSGGWKH